MQCPKCKVEMRATSRYEYDAGDPPAFFLVNDFVCRNPKCENHNRPVKTVKTQLDVAKSAGKEETE